jgi:isopenicillin-N epimerase
MAPKGSSFLYVKKSLQHLLDPLVISWGYNAIAPSQSQFLDYHEQQGTRDFSAFLTVPDSIAFMEENNWDEVRQHYRGMVQNNAAEFCRLLGSTPLAPVNEDFILQLYSAEIKTAYPEKLHDHFFNKYKIQIPVATQNNKAYLRYSLNAFNTQADMDKLFAAIIEIKSSTNLIDP